MGKYFFIGMCLNDPELISRGGTHRAVSTATRPIAMVPLLALIWMMAGCPADASVSIDQPHSHVSVVGTRLTSARLDGLGHREGAAVGAPSRPERHSLSRDLLRLDVGILLAEIAALCVWMFVRAVGPVLPARLRRSSWTRICLIGVALAICTSSRANVLPLDLGAYRGNGYTT